MPVSGMKIFFGGSDGEMRVDTQVVTKFIAPNTGFKHASGANFLNATMQSLVNQVILKIACPRKIISH